jgi:hypothetical protein
MGVEILFIFLFQKIKRLRTDSLTALERQWKHGNAQKKIRPV